MKAIIVIDVDDNIKCDRTYIAYDLYDGDNIDVISKVIGYGYAPLRPFPKRKLEWDWGSGARDWNACLDEIEGKTE